MEENKTKKGEELLAEVYRNCQLALQSIDNILPETADEALKAEIKAQHEEYERVSGVAARLARDKGIELKEPGAFKKMMMWGSIKMSTLKDDSKSHIAEMMVQGTVMGVTALRASLSEAEADIDDELRRLAEELLKSEEIFEERLKAFL
ncbi:MAG: hypothetical protein IJX81_06220 [Clostridia bacterium]|nr:hypothetical protein [Clostridia bacterium]